MKRALSLMVVGIVACGVTAAGAAVTRSTSPNAQVLPDNGCTDDANGVGLGGITSTIDYSDLVGGVITDVNVRVEMTQTWRSDIQAALVLGADTVVLINNFDTSGDNLYATLDDEGAALCSDAANCGTTGNCTAAPGPVCQPNQTLTAFDGDAVGLFTLQVCDRATGDLGNLVAWELTVDGNPPLPVELLGVHVE